MGHLTSIMVLCSVGLVSTFEHIRLVLALGTFGQLSYQFGTGIASKAHFGQVYMVDINLVLVRV